MKKILLGMFSVLAFLAIALPVNAVKPVKDEGAIDVPWHLSGDVMPSPPWGLQDIEGSDVDSKLVVNQPNGNGVEIAVTGILNGLSPNTLYQVYPSKEWKTCEKWNIEGEWNLRFMFGGAYDHIMTVESQNMYTGAFTGYGVSVGQNPEKEWIIQDTSKVVGNTITLDLVYTGANAGYSVHAVGTINSSGEIVDGTWTSSASQAGTWSSTGGTAETETVGCGYPGIFWGQEMFTFTTDENGHASWHFNLTDEDFPGTGTYHMSIWINKPGATILISDNFDVVVE